MTNLERVKGKTGGKKYAPVPQAKSSGWQKVRTHQEKGKRRKQKKKPRQISKNVKNNQSHKRTKLGGKTKIWITKLIRILFSLILPVSLRQAGLEA